MSEARWRRLESLFDEALELDPEHRRAWLARLPEDVRPEMERLLLAHAAAGDFLETPAPAAAAELVTEAEDRSHEGTGVGPYRILREIGRGGMGTVYLAHREDLDLRVAIKQVSAAAPSARSVRAFLSERRTLARLDHPNIARLLDAGVTASGKPYFVMEWIDGESITTNSDARRLGVHDRLRLFLDVCAAVEYAHGRLVVHRDLKPSNVIVTSDGAPKLLDFGIAKLLDESSGGVRAETVGHFMTPPYASPEQIRGETIGTASDVYSLGALLYELLAGRPPYALETGTPFEVGRAILETDPVPLSRAVDEAGAEAVAACRSTNTRRLRRRLEGDLATIVARAMHKGATRRYPSVSALAEDIVRHLDGRAVLARGDSALYRSRRFVGRHRLSLGLAATLVVMAIAFAGFHAYRVTAERDRARLEAQTAEEVSGFLIDVFLAADPDEFDGREPTAQDLLARGADRVRAEVGASPTVRARLLDVLGEVQRKRGRFDVAKSLLTEALAIRRELYPGGDPELIQSLIHVSSLNADQWVYDRAVTFAREAHEMSTDMLGPEHPETVYRLHNLGLFLRNAGDLDEAERILRRSMVERRRLLGDRHTGSAHAVSALANVVRDRGRYDEAAALYTEALEAHRGVYGPDHPRTATVWNNLGRMHARLYAFDEAERCLAEALRIRTEVYGDGSPRLVPTLATRAAVRVDRGDPAMAETDYEAALAIVRDAHGPGHVRSASLWAGLAQVYEELGRPDDAAAAFRSAIAAAEGEREAQPTVWANAAERYGRFLASTDRAADGIGWIEGAIQAYEAANGLDHLDTRVARLSLADAQRKLGDFAAARRTLGAVPVRAYGDEGSSGEANARAIRSRVVARLELAEGNVATARSAFDEAIRWLESYLPPGHPRIGAARDERAPLGS